MIFIADYFAFGLVISLFLFYFDNKRNLANIDKLFVLCLTFTGATALTDILAGLLLDIRHVPLWLNMLVNSLYFVINILTTSSIALFLFHKILEHVHEDHCMTYAKRGLAIIFSVYMVFILMNIWNGWLFYFDEHGQYQRGPLNILGYILTICQMILVCICFFRNRKNASQTMRRFLAQIFPLVIFCIVIQRINPEIMMNGVIMAIVDTILFLTFQSQRPGVHNLTKLNDRHQFFREIESRLKKEQDFQVFSIHLKNFSSINQKYGHLIGNEILYQYAFSLERLLNNSTAFHMNGTVFTLTLPYSTQLNAENNRTLLLEFLENGITFQEETIRTDYVVVEYIANEIASDAKEFYEKLEYAAHVAYQSKQHYIRYVPELGVKMQRNRYLIERMQQIDREHGFEVWYQPIKCIGNDQFCSMEALIRLHEPDGSMISPGEFIPLAEETGLISPITWFVIEEVCKFLYTHPELASINVSINLPMLQMFEKGFRARLNSITSLYNIDHSRICLEFTERAILENFKQTKNIMELMTSDGYRFFLDDFGTGYSNFNCLLQLPFHSIKLDASLNPQFSNIDAPPQFIRRLTSLFHDMNLGVIAEGAETAECVEFLRNQGVDKIQGYYFAKPMNTEKLLEFYSKQI